MANRKTTVVLLLHLQKIEINASCFLWRQNSPRQTTVHSGKDRLIETGRCYGISGFGGLEVTCWPLVPKFASSNPAEAVGFFRAR